jgi:hypothetical protein
VYRSCTAIPSEFHLQLRTIMLVFRQEFIVKAGPFKFRIAKINRPNLFAPRFSAKRPKIKQFGRLISA